MSTPNPLIPQGSLQSQGTSNVRVAVATIVAIHVVFFGGLLLQGCKRDAKLADNAAPVETNTTAGLTYPPIDTKTIDSGSLYYSNQTGLPTEAPGAQTGAVANVAPVPAPANPFANTAPLTNAGQPANDPWKSSNLGAPVTAAAPEAPAVPGREYTIVRGDNFAKIAKAQGTTVSALRKANPSVDPAKIRPGQKLVVPAGAPAAAATGAANAGTAANGGAANGSSYTVKPGDTLTKIAKNHGITVGQLRAANDMKVSRINVGQKLKIPAAAATNKPAAATAAAATNSSF